MLKICHHTPVLHGAARGVILSNPILNGILHLAAAAGKIAAFSYFMRGVDLNEIAR